MCGLIFTRAGNDRPWLTCQLAVAMPRVKKLNDPWGSAVGLNREEMGMSKIFPNYRQSL